MFTIAYLLYQTRFSLIAVEIRGICDREQLVITLRWVSENYDINFKFSLGLFKLILLQLNIFIHL